MPCRVANPRLAHRGGARRTGNDDGMHDQLAARQRHGLLAETGSGHVLTMDGAPDGGGRNLAPRPMETVLAGTGGCTAYDVVLILKSGPARRARLSGETAGAARRDRPQGVHEDPHALRGERARSARGGRRALPSACRTRVLLGQRDAGQDGRDDDELRDRRGPRQEALRRARHESGGRLHRPAHRRRQCGAGGWAASAWRASSARIWIDDRSRCAVVRRQAIQMSFEVAPTCRLRSRPVKPRLAASPMRPARKPIAKAPPYHSGFSRLARAECCKRSCVHAR